MTAPGAPRPAPPANVVPQLSSLVRRDTAEGVLRLTIDRPERRNALSAALIAELRDAVAAAGDDDGVRVLVLSGAGTKAFCAGADLVDPASPVAATRASAAPGGSAVQPAVHAPPAGASSRSDLASLFDELVQLGKPSIARVQGYALAGGFGLACACDLVVASEDAVFGLPEIDIGLWPYIVTVPLLRALSPRRALELMLTGRRITASEAERLGVVNEVVPADMLDEAVQALARTLCDKPPAALRAGRASLYAALDLGQRDALDYLAERLGEAACTEEAAEGRAAFAERRTPSWRSHAEPPADG